MSWMSWHASFRVGVSVLGSTCTASNLDQPKLAETGRSWHSKEQMSTCGNEFEAKFQDCIHEDHWHIASYCCFIRTARTLDSTHKNEICTKFAKRLAGKKRLKVCFSKKLLNLQHRPLWDLCLDAKIYYLHQDTKSAPNHGCHANNWDVHHWNFKAAKLGGIHFGTVWERNVGGIISGETVLKRIPVKGSWEPSSH